jgi:hypothetical protein
VVLRAPDNVASAEVAAAVTSPSICGYTSTAVEAETTGSTVETPCSLATSIALTAVVKPVTESARPAAV